MSELKIERHIWQPHFPNEISITSKGKGDEFEITLKQGEDIEIMFTWDYGYGGRGTEIMSIPVELLRELMTELSL